MLTRKSNAEFYCSLNYDAQSAPSMASMEEAFNAFVGFVSRLNDDTLPGFVEGADEALQVAERMAYNILLSASTGRFGTMSDRGVLACFRVHETRVALNALATQCEIYGGGVDGLNVEDHMMEVDPLREALASATLLLRIASLPMVIVR